MTKYQGRAFDPAETVRQIGRGNMMGISGLRWSTSGTGSDVYQLHLPVSNGYRVDIELAADDTYTVRRVFSRKPKGQRFAEPVDYVKGERTGVYFDEVGLAAYYASCYRSYDETEWVAQS